MDDRISSLPEELICHILSFLPTKQVVATSALSKNWKSLWRSVLTLTIDLEYVYTRNFRKDGFVQLVNAFTHSRDLHQPIHKFRLTFISSDYDGNSTRIREWVNAVVQRRVQHLELFIHFSQCCEQPTTNILPTIFTCRTLVILKLQLIDVKLLSKVDLPFLKVLHLMLLKSGCLALLLSGCPVLEDFQVRGPQFFYNHSAEREFKTLPKLVRADISKWNSRFLLAVNNVEFLRIQQMNMKDICPDGEGTGPYVFPKFQNLNHIELNYVHYITDWLQLVELLKHCPKLQALVIKQKSRKKVLEMVQRDELIEIEVGDWQYPPPGCTLLCLKRCYLDYYSGTKGEFQFARYIMQNGRSLESMTICIGTDLKDYEKMSEKLYTCTRSSATCNLSIKYYQTSFGIFTTQVVS